jgi:voltage-gated potassium channel
MMTTLSTIGYGDYYPVSSPEKMVNIVIQIVCTTLFGITVGNLLDANAGGDLRD